MAFCVAFGIVFGDAARASSPAPSGPPPALSVALLGIVSQPFDLRSRGAGVGAAVGYRLTDQISVTADAARLFARGGQFSTFAAGLQAVLDSTPISPYLALSLVKLAPAAITGTGFAARTAIGAQVRLTRSLSLGLEARAFTPLSDRSGSAPASGGELALRVVLFPLLLR
jgi:hypothetical protein